MTEADISSIERELAIKLPHDYRQVLRSYPFPKGSNLADNAMPDDAKRLIENNLLFRSEVEVQGARWPNHYFLFGDDGGEGNFFFDVSLAKSPVYMLEVEGWSISVDGDDLGQWIEKRLAIDEEFEKEERERGSVFKEILRWFRK